MKKKEKKLADILSDIYDRIYFLNNKLQNLSDKLDKKFGDEKKIEILEEFDKEYYLESLITFISEDRDFEDLQKILDEHEKNILINQYGET